MEPVIEGKSSSSSSAPLRKSEDWQIQVKITRKGIPSSGTLRLATQGDARSLIKTRQAVSLLLEVPPQQCALSIVDFETPNGLARWYHCNCDTQGCACGGGSVFMGYNVSTERFSDISPKFAPSPPKLKGESKPEIPRPTFIELDEAPAFSLFSFPPSTGEKGEKVEKGEKAREIRDEYNSVPRAPRKQKAPKRVFAVPPAAALDLAPKFEESQNSSRRRYNTRSRSKR